MIYEPGSIIIFDELGSRITGIVLRKTTAYEHPNNDAYWFHFSDGIGNEHPHSMKGLKIDKHIPATPLSRFMAVIYG
jgi:hypothetical protein